MAAQSGLGFSGIVAIQIPDDGATGEVLTKLSPENYDYDWAAGGGGGAPTNAEYVVVSLDATLTDERVITGGTGITLVDGGANGNITINFDAATAGYTLQNAFDAGNTMDSTTQGVSIPDMTQAQRNAIGVPASGAGTLIFNTDTGQTNQWDGAAWTVPGAGLTTLQGAYDNSGGANPMIQLALADGTLTIRDDATPLADMFALQNNAGTDFFDVDALTMNYGLTGNRGYSFVLDPTGREGIQFLPDGRAQTTVPLTTAAVQWSSLVVSNIPGGAPFGNDTAPAMIASIGEAQFDSQPFLFATSLLFNQATTLSANGFNLGPVYTMVNQPIVRNVGGGVRTTSQANAVRSQMRVGPNISGDMTLVSHEPFFVTMTVDATVGIASATTVNYFAPKAPTLTAGGTIGTLNVLDIPAIPGAGITTLRGINSAMSAGQFINHTGSASIEFTNAAFAMRFDDNARIEMGTGNDVDIFWDGSSLDFLFALNADTLAINNPNNGHILFDTGANEMGFNSTRGVQFGSTGTLGNQIYNFTANAHTVTVAGGFAQVLLTQSGNLNLGVLAMSDVSAWVVNQPSFDNTAYSITELATMKVGGMTTSNPGGTVTERAGLWTTGRHLHRGSWQVVPINPAALAAGNNNDWAGLLTGSPNNNTRYWARISGNAVTSVITGIDATAVQDGDTFELTNVSANAIDITDQDAASTAANRIITPTGVTYTLSADETVVIRYDSTTTRWRLLGGTGA